MIETFLQYLQQFFELDKSEQQLVIETLIVKEYKKGDFLLKSGQISTSFFFNLKGLVRLFYLKNGEEKTAWFYPEKTFISAYASYTRQEPARMNFQVVEDTSLVEITQAAAITLLAASEKFDFIARAVMEEEMIHHQQMVEFLLTMTPIERYDQLLADNPNIFQRVPQHYIASFIGVKPESLSRIKRRSRQKS